MASLQYPQLQSKAFILITNLIDLPEFRKISPTLHPDIARLYSSGLFANMITPLASRNLAMEESHIRWILVILPALYEITFPTAYSPQFSSICSTPTFVESFSWWFKNGNPRLQALGAHFIWKTFELTGDFNLWMEQGLFNCDVYSRLMFSIHGDPALKFVFTLNFATLLNRVIYQKAISHDEMVKWVPVLIQLASKADDGDIDLRGTYFYALTLIQHESRRLQRFEQCAKAVLGNDGGETFFKAACRPLSNGYPVFEAMDSIQMLFGFSNPTNLNQFINPEQMFDLLWKCGFEQTFKKFCDHLHTKQHVIDRTAVDIIRLLLLHAPPRYLDAYPNFLNTTLVASYDRAIQFEASVQGSILFDLPRLVIVDHSPHRLALVAKSPIISRVTNVIHDAAAKIQRDGTLSQSDLKNLQPALGFLQNCTMRCLQPDLNYAEALPYDLLEMLVGWATDNGFLLSIACLTALIHPDIPKVPSPHRKHIEESQRAQQQELTDLLGPLHFLHRFSEQMTNLIFPNDGEDDQVVIQTWCRDLATDNCESQFMNSVLNSLPELRIKARELREMRAAGKKNDDDVSTTTTTPTTATTNQTPPIPQPQPPKPQSPPRVKSQQEKFEARRAKNQKANTTTKAKNNDPNGMD